MAVCLLCACTPPLCKDYGEVTAVEKVHSTKGQYLVKTNIIHVDTGTTLSFYTNNLYTVGDRVEICKVK